MNYYWLKFTDGSEGCCQGQSPYDAKIISEHLTGKVVEGSKYEPKAQVLPYPADPVIWQLDHPVVGKTPSFCWKPRECQGRTSCPRNRSCVD